MRGTSSSCPLEYRPAYPLEHPPLNPLERPRSCHLEKWFVCVTCVSVCLCDSVPLGTTTWVAKRRGMTGAAPSRTQNSKKH